MKADNPASKHPLWLLVVGERRHELSLEDLYQAYTQPSDLEHFFRFGKQRLLLASYQTPEVGREEGWCHLAHLAYLQLWVAREVATCLPRPWERHLPLHQAGKSTPTLVQRDFEGLIQHIGTPAKAPKPRGKSPGTQAGLPFASSTRAQSAQEGRKSAALTGKRLVYAIRKVL